MSRLSTIAMRLAAGAASVLGSAVILAISGCGGSSPQTVAAHKIADRLPRIIGPARHYDVQVDGDPFAIGRGRARKVTIDGRNVVMASGLTMDRLTIEADDVSFDVKSRTLQHIGHVSFMARLGQLNLDKYLSHIKPNLPELSIKLRWDDMEVAAPVEVASLTTTARLSGTLTPSQAGPDKLDFLGNKASVGVVPVPSKIISLALERINPVLNLSGSRFPVSITSAAVDRGSIILRGTATIDKL